MSAAVDVGRIALRPTSTAADIDVIHSLEARRTGSGMSSEC